MGSSGSVPASEKVKNNDNNDQADNANNMDQPDNNNNQEMAVAEGLIANAVAEGVIANAVAEGVIANAVAEGVISNAVAEGVIANAVDEDVIANAVDDDVTVNAFAEELFLNKSISLVNGVDEDIVVNGVDENIVVNGVDENIVVNGVDENIVVNGVAEDVVVNGVDNNSANSNDSETSEENIDENEPENEDSSENKDVSGNEDGSENNDGSGNEDGSGNNDGSGNEDGSENNDGSGNEDGSENNDGSGNEDQQDNENVSNSEDDPEHENVPENNNGLGNEDDVDMNDPEEEMEAGTGTIPMILLKYKCYPLSSFKRKNAKEISESHPGSLILHNDALQILLQLEAPFPYAFEVRNPKNSQTTHCGVSEFTAKKGACYIPDWIMENMGLVKGQHIFVKYVKLPLGNTVLMEPQSVDFLTVNDPKAVLQNSLAKFHCVSAGDIVPIVGEGKAYKMKVLKTDPENAICIRDCDLTVDFVKPVGYVEPQKEVPPEVEDFLSPTAIFVPFSGAGHTIDGKTVDEVQQSGAPKRQSGIPDHKWEVGNLNFIRKPLAVKSMRENVKARTAPFEGAGFILGSRSTNNNIEHPPPDFDPSDEAPTKKQRLDDTAPLVETFVEESEEVLLDMEEDIEMEDYNELNELLV